MKRMVTAALLPWLIVGAISAAVVGTAAKNLAAEQAATQKTTEGEIPPLEVIPELAVIEPYDPTRPNDP